MHADRSYSQERAEEIMTTVKLFIASFVDEDFGISTASRSRV
jgi:hypothetical protein